MRQLCIRFLRFILAFVILHGSSITQTLPAKSIFQRNVFTPGEMHFKPGAITLSLRPNIKDDAYFWTAGFSSQDSLPKAEEISPPSSEINYGRLAIIGGIFAGTMVFIHVYQQNGWWKDNRAPFHFQEDLVYGLNVDKIGHMYAATVFAFVAQRAFEWTNVSELTALWLGAGGALMFQTYVEIEDGFSAWGFDRVDFASDVAGAAWPVARYYVPFLQNFDIKFSYHPSPLLNSGGGSGFVGQHHLIFDDYEGQTLWLSFRMHELLPNSVNSYWPRFLQLAVGYAARDIVGPNPYPILFFSFDYDMTQIIPPDTWFLKTLGEALNFIHFPAPAVQIYPRGGSSIWYGLYF